MSCAAALRRVSLGPRSSRFVNHTRDQHAIVPDSPTKLRRIWDCIPFGFELDMLWLHLQTLGEVVDRFVIAESNTTHSARSAKPLVLTSLLANGSVPKALQSLATKMTVRVVDFHQGRARYCQGGRWVHNRVMCFEAFQRFVLVETVIELASPGDLALFGDTDEIAKPDVVRMLAQCYPFDGDAASKERPFFYILKLSLYQYGVHCQIGNDWKHGTRAFSVATLQAMYGQYENATPAALGEMSTGFTRYRERVWSAPLHESYPTIPNAGWHFTSFGEPWELARKLRTWSHHGIFLHSNLTDLARLERCSRHCLDLRGIQNRTCTGEPSCKGRPAAGCDALVPGKMLTTMSSTSDLPPPLLKERTRYSTQLPGIGMSSGRTSAFLRFGVPISSHSLSAPLCLVSHL